MTQFGCLHKPPCPVNASRWVCGQRTKTEDAMNRGWITRELATSLLKKYGVPITPPSRVMKGEPVKEPEQGKLV
jgi:hypothetical protein